MIKELEDVFALSVVLFVVFLYLLRKLVIANRENRYLNWKREQLNYIRDGDVLLKGTQKNEFMKERIARQKRHIAKLKSQLNQLRKSKGLT